MEVVLQESRTLDEAIVSAVKTFPNGCNYRLRKDADGTHWLEYGCLGVLVNLQTGDGALLHKWFTSPSPAEVIFNAMSKKDGRRLHPSECAKGIEHLLRMEPCGKCGGARFAKQSIATPFRPIEE